MRHDVVYYSNRVITYLTVNSRGPGSMYRKIYTLEWSNSPEAILLFFKRRKPLRNIDRSKIDGLPYPSSSAENARITFVTAVNVFQAYLEILQ